MKKALAILVVLSFSLAVSPVSAEEGNLGPSLLADLGLGSMNAMSDVEGLQIRGMDSNAFAFGASSLTAQLSDPQNPGNFITATDINGARGSDENGGVSADSLATQGPQGSSLALSLDIQSGNPAIQVFLGVVLANAGNASNAGAAGLSAATGN